LKSSGDLFIEHALNWFGDEVPNEGTPWAKAIRLAKLVRSYRTLLILDGLEPLQYAPGPKVGQIENPAVALLVRELAADNKGLCVITSRLAVPDLEPYADGRAVMLELGHLGLEASKNILRSLGVVGDESEYDKAVKQYAGHPLSLMLLGGFLSVVHGGDIRKFREVKSLLDDQKLGSHARDLMRVYLEWFENKPESQLLFLIGLFDRGVRLTDIKQIVETEMLEGLTDKLAALSQAQWSYAISLLHEANLISVLGHKDDVLLDCHPIIRHFISDQLQATEPAIWQSAHEIIFYRLQAESVENPANIAELEPLFRAVIHGTQAGKYTEAFQVYFERIKKRQFSMFTEGSHHADHACIRSFFRKCWSQPEPDLPEEAKFHLLSSAAANLIYLGYIQEAIEPSLISINWFIKHEKWIDAANAAGPLFSMLIASGELGKAISFMHEMGPIIEGTENSVIKATASNFKAYVYYLSGNNDLAKSNFEQAEKVLLMHQPEEQSRFVTISSYYCKFLLDTGLSKQALERSLKTFAWRKQQSWQVAVDTTSLLASDILVLGLTFLKLGDRVNAKIQLDKQVELFRASDEWLYIPTGLNARARFYIATHSFSEALTDLQESLEISRRTGARFGEWEAYIDLAQLYYRQGDLASSKNYLNKARELPNMEVYRFRDAELEQLESRLYT
jgi:tetratricopeptide (TPR) repeat protein